ncbi:transcriptional regulator [Serratia marcescens]|uniref:Rha family transcriptional regulator n=1 Tax=Serratia marcescens TaxID=615 RepID=A0ABD5BBC1_SERMA|nr:Rha family transcriptional regulator [Serratia marcescens]MDQ9401632.1 Rha family transcriptional regulator [Serratia marcescens]MDQ9428371.1 Rha family transcriptional regulator [Serratia marcescens]MDQ9429740.1 Rha family transcriptional regulator [Serratia marcescens]MDQ9477800.1 Rha family transcriptional regulator [Serratia marcescens]MDQ9529249.1 Rha family transcriptional regulator [Serratia marcescens]
MTGLTVAKARSVVTKMSSREIATLTGKQHKHVLDDCRKMFEALKIQSAEFSADYRDERGRTYQEFLLDQDLTMTLVMGYSIPLRHKVAKRWRELETGEALPTKSNSGLPEYRRARTLKMTVEAVTNLFDLMPNLAPEAKQAAAASLINPVAGFDAIPLPKLQEHYYSAGEVGEILGVSANKVGRLANAHGLKKEGYGIFVMDKSKHSVKQVEAFRYNAAGVDALRSIVSVDAGA